MIQNNKTFQIIKHNRNLTSKYQKKKELYRFRHWVKNSVGHLYELQFLPDQIPQFVNESNHSLCNIDVIFVCPLTFCICSMSLFSKGTNSH